LREKNSKNNVIRRFQNPFLNGAQGRVLGGGEKVLNSNSKAAALNSSRGVTPEKKLEKKRARGRNGRRRHLCVEAKRDCSELKNKKGTLKVEPKRLVCLGQK